MKVALYARVSSEEQREHQSIETQIQALESFAERNQFPVHALYRDEAVSGSLPFSARPAGARLLADAAKGAFIRVYVYMFDRFSRDVLEGLLDARTLKNAGVGIASLFEPFTPDDPYGHSSFVQSLNNAELWKKQFLFRVIDGQKRKARSGAWCGGGSAFYGYRVDGKRRDTRLAIDNTHEPAFGAARADIVRWMFAEVAARRLTCGGVAASLNALGVPAAEGGRWFAAKIAAMMRATVYKGEHYYGVEASSHLRETGCRADVPPLIAPDLWEAAQEAVAGNRWRERPGNRPYLLRGLIRCAHCGSGYTGVTYPGYAEIANQTENVKGVYYRCNWRSRHDCEPCAGRNLPGAIEGMVWGEIEAFLADPATVERAVREQIAAAPPAPENTLPAIAAAIERRAGERAAVISLCRRGLIGEADMAGQLDDIARQVAGLEADRERQQNAAQEHARGIERAARAGAAVAGIAASLGSHALSWEEKRQVVELLVEGLTVRTGEPGQGAKRGEISVTVRYRFGESSPPSGRSSGDGGDDGRGGTGDKTVPAKRAHGSTFHGYSYFDAPAPFQFKR